MMRSNRLKRQTGQSSIEYIVVVAALVIALNVGNPSAIESLVKVIKDNYKGYSFAISLSELPD